MSGFQALVAAKVRQTPKSSDATGAKYLALGHCAPETSQKAYQRTLAQATIPLIPQGEPHSVFRQAAIRVGVDF